MSLESLASSTVAEAATRFFLHLSGDTRQQSQQGVNRFVRWLGGSRTLGSVSSHEVASYVESMGDTTTDILQRLEPVKAFLAYAKKEGYTAANLGVNLRPKKSNTRSAREKARQAAAMQPEYLSKEGHQQLVSELDALKAERPNIAATLRLAMADKDFRENAPLDAARDQQAHLEAHIRELEGLLRRAEVMQAPDVNALRAQLGSTVLLWDVAIQAEFRVTLVHPHEANVAQGKVSMVSPLGKAVLERGEGEEIEVNAPAGVLRYRIQTVERTQ